MHVRLGTTGHSIVLCVALGTTECFICCAMYSAVYDPFHELLSLLIRYKICQKHLKIGKVYVDDSAKVNPRLWDAQQQMLEALGHIALWSR